MVKTAAGEFGYEAEISHLADPRVEAEEHYYSAKHSGLIELGLKPFRFTMARSPGAGAT